MYSKHNTNLFILNGTFCNSHCKDAVYASGGSVKKKHKLLLTVLKNSIAWHLDYLQTFSIYIFSSKEFSAAKFRRSSKPSISMPSLNSLLSSFSSEQKDDSSSSVSFEQVQQ